MQTKHEHFLIDIEVRVSHTIVSQWPENANNINFHEITAVAVCSSQFVAFKMKIIRRVLITEI